MASVVGLVEVTLSLKQGVEEIQQEGSKIK
jgi:hypothetical protein